MNMPRNPSFVLKEKQLKSVEKDNDLTAAQREAKKRKAEETKKNNKHRRDSFKTLFDKYITPDKADKIVKSIVDIVLNDDIKPQDRLKAFEIICKVLGEDYDKLSTNELDNLEQVIKIEIG